MLRPIGALIIGWDVLRNVIGSTAVFSSVLSASKSVCGIAFFESVSVVHLVILALEPDIFRIPCIYARSLNLNVLARNYKSSVHKIRAFNPLKVV